MARLRVCDVCGKPAQVGAKLYLAPLNENDVTMKTVMSNYTASMDIGMCCIEKIRSLGKWTKRKTRGNSNGTNPSVAAGKSTAKKP